jgi:hypothetical protein
MKGFNYFNRNSIVAGCFLVITFVISLFQAAFGDSSKGIVSGNIVDSETGEPLPGATVRVENSNFGGISDLDGTYRIKKIPAGAYNLRISLLGYADTEIKSVSVFPDDVVKIDASLTPEALAVNDIVVEGRAIYDNEASLLKQRQLSTTVSDAISAEAISRTGSGDAGEALKQVTGATVMGGKYVLVRGLGDRYSNAQLNGAELPSADPDKKSFQMDLLPSVPRQILY